MISSSKAWINKVFLQFGFQMKPIIYSLFNYPHSVITGPKNLAPASKQQLQSPRPPRVLVLHDLFWSGDNIFRKFRSYNIQGAQISPRCFKKSFIFFYYLDTFLIHTMNLCEENVKLIVLTVYKRFLEAHKFCLCHNLLNSQWRSFIENVGLVSNFVRSDSSLLF